MDSYLARNVSYHKCQVAMIPRNVRYTYPIASIYIKLSGIEMS